MKINPEILKFAKVFILLDLCVIIYAFLFHNSLWALNTQVAFLSSLFITIASFLSYKRNIQNRISNLDITQTNQSFDRDKMYRSLSLALRKRDIETEKIEKIVNAIVRKLENSGEGEIRTALIGQYIMEALANLDQVAYVRFASVYKNFREVKDFEDFLGNLEEK